MQYHDLINTESVDSQVVGILVVIPVTNSEMKPIVVTHERCEKCKREQHGYGEFCSHCGGKIIEVTENLKQFRDEIAQQSVPIPDVRNEMKELGIESHVPFREDFKDIKDGIEWVFVAKEYATIGDRNYFKPFLDELDLLQIQEDLAEAKEKFKEVIQKYNGRVVFGITEDHTDW